MTRKQISDYMAKLGRKGGKKAAAGMTQEQRKERARKAALKRFAKQGGQQ